MIAYKESVGDNHGNQLCLTACVVAVYIRHLASGTSRVLADA